MKKLFSLGLLAAMTWSCSSNDSQSASEKPESDVDAARTFIREALDGKFKKVRNLTVQDSTNMQLLDSWERTYLQYDAMEQRSYRESSIRVHQTRKINDTASVVVYSNSFKNKQDSVKAVKVGNDWLIDLKYSFPQTRITQ